MAPVYFLEKAYLSLVNRLGPRVEVQLLRPGFNPAGRGKLAVHVRPSKQLGRLELLDHRLREKPLLPPRKKCYFPQNFVGDT